MISGPAMVFPCERLVPRIHDAAIWDHRVNGGELAKEIGAFRQLKRS